MNLCWTEWLTGCKQIASESLTWNKKDRLRKSLYFPVDEKSQGNHHTCLFSSYHSNYLLLKSVFIQTFFPNLPFFPFHSHKCTYSTPIGVCKQQATILTDIKPRLSLGLNTGLKARGENGRENVIKMLFVPFYFSQSCSQLIARKRLFSNLVFQKCSSCNHTFKPSEQISRTC